MRDYQGVYGYFKSKYKILGKGTTRAVFRLNRNWVIKMPINSIGDTENVEENQIYKSGDPNVAKNFLVTKWGFAFLVMEYIEHYVPKELEEWMWSVDSLQIGKNKHGEIKAYDYGSSRLQMPIDWYEGDLTK